MSVVFLSARVSRSTASLRRGAKQTISGLAQPRRRVQNPFGRAKTKRPTNLEKCGFVGLFLSNDFLDCFGKCSNRVAIEIIFYRWFVVNRRCLHEYNAVASLTKGEYFVKLEALSHIDELVAATSVQRNRDGSRRVVPDQKNHPFAKDGFEYRTVYFRDFDGKYYRIVLSVGLNEGIATVYNVGKIKETAAPDGTGNARRW